MRKGIGSVNHESRVRDVNFPKPKKGVLAPTKGGKVGVAKVTIPGRVGFGTNTPVGAKTAIGKRLSKLAGR